MFEDFKLKVFKAVAECHSFTLAARQLGISQPAVSQNISDLERMSGTQLFVRAKGEVSLTPAGRLFESLADRVIQSYEDLNSVFSDYEHFDEIVEKAQELKDDPRFRVIKDLYL